MGERWKIDGRRREVTGRACPAPTGGGRVSGCRPGTGRRRGQDPSLRCERLEGGYGKVRGPGMPGPYGVVVVGAMCFPHSAHVNVENTCNFYLIIIV